MQKTTRVHTIWTVCCLILIFWISGCQWVGGDSLPEEASSAPHPQTRPATGCELGPGLHTLYIDSIAVDVYVPYGPFVGDLLVLPPWGSSREEWCDKARLCQRASKRGYRLIMPEMGNTVYPMTIYPETRPDWRSAVTIPWLKDQLIPILQEQHCMLQAAQSNYLIGASTGARGAVLLAASLPSLFSAIAALSGDYDPSLVPGDNIYRGFFGEFEEYHDRWNSEENVVAKSASIRCPVYLGHGMIDPFVPFAQTTELYKALQRSGTKPVVQLSLVESMGGDFPYWSWELHNVLDFFDETKASRPESAM